MDTLVLQLLVAALLVLQVADRVAGYLTRKKNGTQPADFKCQLVKLDSFHGQLDSTLKRLEHSMERLSDKLDRECGQ